MNVKRFMGRFKHFLLSFLASFVLLQFVHGQSQQGFISIDCGGNSSYTEPNTGLNYIPDSSFIDTGTIRSIPSSKISSTLEKQLRNMRSFPQGTRNCYNVQVKVGTKYLIRASFLYENYDGQNSLPEFDLHFGANFWVTVELGLAENIIEKEIIHITTSDNVQVCLVNTGNGMPFISALELRPLAKASYQTVSGSLATFLRLDIGATNSTFIRFPDDVYDRSWSPPVTRPGWVPISTSSPVSSNDNIGFNAPSSVLNTASTVANASAPMIIPWSDDPEQTNQFYIYFYFAELEILQPNQSRAFKIYCNDKLFYSKDVSPAYLNENVIYSQEPLSISSRYEFNLIMSEGSTLPPILNALEIFKVINFDQLTTDQGDVDAIESIKKGYGVAKEDWQGDPCAPKALAWRAVTCKYDGSNPPRITALNLSFSGLTGEISNNIMNLAKLEVLDLSNNNLSGAVPNFLAEMPFLRALNLAGNNLSGQVPFALIDKKNKASLSLSLDGNPNLYVTAPSEKKKNNILIPILAAVGGVIVILLILASIYFIRRRTSPRGPVMVKPHHSPQNSPFEPQPLGPIDQQPSKRYSYAEILKYTNHFDTLLGEGGFGKVYYGRIGNTEIAVKILSAKSAQGYQEFQAEVDILLRVHHRNLTGLVGYCNEGETKMGLIYEYMGRGNLGSLLLGGKGDVLRWKDRLQIALDSAQGLEYLHNGCRPPIIHRDIKSTNILLNEHLQAKLADFGLSRALPIDGGATHVTTKVVGTPGYLDPQYYTTFRLTDKSDIYSFGIVIMELISGRPVIVKTSERSHITKWIDYNINQGDIYSIIDPKIKDGCNVNTVWKAVDMAMACTASDPSNRPTMSQVVSELKECLNLELNQSEDRQLDSTMSISSTFNCELGPIAR